LQSRKRKRKKGL